MFFLWSFDGAAEGRLPGVVVPEVWYHSCHVFEKQGYTVYWQGEVSETHTYRIHCRIHVISGIALPLTL